MLAGRRIVVTRTQEGSAQLAARLRALGAEVEEVPLLRIVPPDEYAPLDAALSHLSSYNLLLVTSANTARALTDRRPPPWPDQPFTAAIGPATAATLRSFGLRVDLVPEAAVGEALLAALLPLARDRRVFLPRASAARDLLPQGLRDAGAHVDVVATYKTVPAEHSRERLAALFAPGAPPVDFITFTSGSTVQNFFALLGRAAAGHALESALACSIGPVTTAALRCQGIHSVAEAAQHTLDGLVALLVEKAATGRT